MRIALMGLENSGKRSFFAMLTGRGGVLSSKKMPPIKEGEAVEGVAAIYDERVDILGKMFKPERIKYAENHIVLCPNMVFDSQKKEWIDVARRCDLLCIVIRDFSAAEVFHPQGNVDAARDRAAIESELLLTDLELIEKRLERIDREKKSETTPQQAIEEAALKKLKSHIENHTKLVVPQLSNDELLNIRSLSLFIMKPVIWAYNVDENRVAEKRPLKNEFNLSCKLEEELMALENEDERKAFMKELGIEKSGLDRLNAAAYSEMGLMSFYTVGSDEVRAWTIKKGTRAPEAGGKVHTDIERGFIRAEIIKYDDLIAAGSEAAAKAQGKMQLKGKDYIIEDGDICHFRFNV
jgi:GTP-binding protein YchF